MEVAKKFSSVGAVLAKGIGEEGSKIEEDPESNIGALAPAARGADADRCRDEVAKKVMYRPETLPNGKVWATKGVWASVLSPQEYACLRDHKMGAPLSSKYVNFPKKKNSSGAFCCKGCGLEVFAVSDYLSDDSLREGYPSFSKAMPANLDKRFEQDQSISLFCIKCDSFIGRTRASGFADGGGLQMLTMAASHSIVLKNMSASKEEALLKDRKRESNVSNGMGASSRRMLSIRSSGGQSPAVLSPVGGSSRQVSSPDKISSPKVSPQPQPRVSGRMSGMLSPPRKSGVLSPPRLSGRLGPSKK
eukprot:CAMPEP_0185843832 /NCGR_PEP_ID=MMETSP1354-20130828/220_1 /TAXON_ID=708628 /ORGANISM="Erythrolobus madagascarensis, Strain CCMP3276" /LENGTH=303 /DNA_ID=CAMNT_0028543397 /DNA_START=122 /DNA_END=1033 /DNA_ORIENTATION=-